MRSLDNGSPTFLPSSNWLRKRVCRRIGAESFVSVASTLADPSTCDNCNSHKPQRFRQAGLCAIQVGELRSCHKTCHLHSCLSHAVILTPLHNFVFIQLPQSTCRRLRLRWARCRLATVGHKTSVTLSNGLIPSGAAFETSPRIACAKKLKQMPAALWNPKKSTCLTAKRKTMTLPTNRGPKSFRQLSAKSTNRPSMFLLCQDIPALHSTQGFG